MAALPRQAATAAVDGEDIDTNESESESATPRHGTSTSTASAGVVTTTTTPSATEPCYFLNLAAELRNRIYEYTFTNDAEGAIDICTAQPPSKSLIMSCSKIHAEAHLMYKGAFRSYWETSEFVMRDIINGGMTEKIAALPMDAVGHVKHLQLEAHVSSPYSHSAMMKNGIWWSTSRQAAGTQYCSYIHFATAEEFMRLAEANGSRWRYLDARETGWYSLSRSSDGHSEVPAWASSLMETRALTATELEAASNYFFL